MPKAEGCFETLTTKRRRLLRKTTTEYLQTSLHYEWREEKHLMRSQQRPRAQKFPWLKIVSMLGLVIALPFTQLSFGQDESDAEPAKPLTNQVEDLKQAVLDLNRDLLILEEELLFPANTQIAIFLSMDVGEFFQLDAVKINVDNKLVASHLYTPQQADALFRGGVQRVYIGNLRSGTHEITAFFTGKGPEGREYKRAATISLEKELDPKMLELRIVDSTTKLQPVFDIKEWEL